MAWPWGIDDGAVVAAPSPEAATVRNVTAADGGSATGYGCWREWGGGGADEEDETVGEGAAVTAAAPPKTGEFDVKALDDAAVGVVLVLALGLAVVEELLMLLLLKPRPAAGATPSGSDDEGLLKACWCCCCC